MKNGILTVRIWAFCVLTGAFLGNVIAGGTDRYVAHAEGYPLKSSKNLQLWWCESGWKVGREQPAPASAKPVAVEVSLARNEYEPVQIVLRPQTDCELVAATVSSFRRGWGYEGDISAQISEVAYVEVKVPTDKSSNPGFYPDPLPKLQSPLPLKAGKNQPLWVTFHAPTNAHAGVYRASLSLLTSLGTAEVPMLVRVYDFTLPAESHLRSALGLNFGSVRQYHGLSRSEDQRLVYEKYLQNFAEHRISPYSFFDFTPMDIRFVGEGANKQAKIDFAKFDAAAAKWLDEHHFNTFRLPLKGMGHGTFHSRKLGELEGFEEGTPEHTRLFRDYLGQVQEHLRQRGWLDKAYTYWFDEPDKKDYGFVVDGMKRLKSAAPNLKRMLTEQPEGELIGNVDIWCALTSHWDRKLVQERRKAGDEVWWYICCGPKAPYLGEFIDRPGTELRLWPWQSWQEGVQGILIWDTTYWNSELVYVPPKKQNPWEDPMSYLHGYGHPVGHVGYWGNGDGRFLYPPRRDPNGARTPCLDGPVNSLRWETLRDGMEDYEYFWLLSEALKRAETAGGDATAMAEAKAVLEVPAGISKDTKNFTKDPRPMLAHRHKMALAIERLKQK